MLISCDLLLRGIYLCMYVCVCMDVGMDGKGLLVIDYEVGRVVDKQQAGLQVGWMMGGLITVY